MARKETKNWSSLVLLSLLIAFGLLLAFKATRFDKTLFAGLSPLPQGGRAVWNPQTLVQGLPEKIPGTTWKRRGKADIFVHARIPDKINGAIVDYDRYGVKGLVFASYQDPLKSGRGVDLYLYEMGSPADALGIFSFFIPPSAKRLPLGDGGWQDRTSVSCHVGSLLIQALGTVPGVEVANAAKGLVALLSDNLFKSLKGGDNLAPLGILPEGGRLPGSECYYRKDAFEGDYPFLTHLFMAEYDRIGVTLLVMAAGDAQGARQAFTKWQEKLGDEAQEIEGVKCSFTASEEAAALVGPYLLGVMGAPSVEYSVKRIKEMVGRAREAIRER